MLSMVQDLTATLERIVIFVHAARVEQYVLQEHSLDGS